MRFLKDRSGMEMLEAAITTPIAILVMLAIVNLGMVVYAQQAVQAAARHGARMGQRRAAMSGLLRFQCGAVGHLECRHCARCFGECARSRWIGGKYPQNPGKWYSAKFPCTIDHAVPRLARGYVQGAGRFDIPPGRMVAMRRDRRAYTMTFWAVFIGFVMVPALALAIELGRYFYAISEVAKAADAAAVAAAAEINQ